jgi:acyl-ACP thioesterase
MEAPVPDEMAVRRPEGRVFEQEMRPLLADCAPSGRIRLDSIARWMQDVAYADIEETEVADHAFWVVRRVHIRVDRFPRLGERCAVQTFCSGLGRMWAERRTTITPFGDAAGQRASSGESPIVEAVSLWIHLDPQRRVPSVLTAREVEIYGAGDAEPRIHHRLRHPKPVVIETAGEWTFRESDCDLADHVNNSAYWQLLEQELIAGERNGAGELRQIEAEIEFRTPALPGRKTVLADGPWRWLVGVDGDEEVYASTVLMNARTTPGSN